MKVQNENFWWTKKKFKKKPKKTRKKNRAPQQRNRLTCFGVRETLQNLGGKVPATKTCSRCALSMIGMLAEGGARGGAHSVPYSLDACLFFCFLPFFVVFVFCHFETKQFPTFAKYHQFRIENIVVRGLKTVQKKPERR